MSKTLGDPMRQAVPPEARGASEVDEALYRRFVARFCREVKEYLEDGTLADALADLEADVTAIATALAGILRTTITDALGNVAVRDNPEGHTTVQVYDERVGDLLEALIVQLAELNATLTR